ncbi:hypothetical protein ACFQVA_41750 [Actinomadura keratinilytica]
MASQSSAGAPTSSQMAATGRRAARWRVMSASPWLSRRRVSSWTYSVASSSNRSRRAPMAFGVKEGP